ncbi:hypothetical protein BGW39_000747 [Mortierella sp. 14UC]|nr:hypothetical protein BGW39_000747 [Mortierella sp. 14UC]
MGSAGFLGQHQYDGPRLLNHLKALNIRLQGFHFSLYREAGANAALDELMMTDGMGAGSTEWDFANGSLTPKLMQHIRQLPNMVTSLTFHDPLLSHHAAMPLLHQYLCDHNSSHLLHLRAPQATYPIAHMDLFRRIPEPINILKSFDRAAALAEIKATPRGVWKCRNLETLHIGFEIPGGWGTRHQPEQSRVVFGYIARVLPRLCELFIHTQVENHVFPFQKLRLEGGFCLLAKLKWLERLQICDQRTPLPPKQLHDLEWMVSVGWTEKGRDKRRRAMAPWRKPILLEDEKEAKRVASIERLCSGSGSTGNGSRGGSGVSKGMKWGSTVDEALKEELRHLGRLLDVKLWLDEMVSPESSGDGSENRPWPSLRMIAIACNRVYGSPPLSEFYRLERAREYARYENRR